jgi:hypothetical protein
MLYEHGSNKGLQMSRCLHSSYAPPASDMASYCNVPNAVKPVDSPDVKSMMAY